MTGGITTRIVRMMAWVAVCATALAISLPATAANAATVPNLSFTGGGGSYVVAEGAAVGTRVGEVRAVDVNPAATVTYSLGGGTGLAIDASTGAISVTASPSTSTGLSRTFKVNATDGTNTASATFTLLVMPASTLVNGITQERWDGIGGGSVSDLTSNSAYKGTPTESTIANQIDLSASVRDSFGMRYSGFLVAPTTGSYTFWIASDDSSELWLGTAAASSTLGTAPIATVSSWTGLRSWGAGTTQQSAAVNLVKGQIYALRVLFKEGGGAEHVSVAWRGPGMNDPVNGSTTNVIPQSALYPASAIDWTPPPAPAYASVSKVTATTTSLAWHSVTDPSGVTKYLVSRDGKKIGEVAAGSSAFYAYNDTIGAGTHSYAITAVDGKGNVSTAATLAGVVTGTTFDPIGTAVATGDASGLTDPAAVVAAAQAEISALRAAQSGIISNLYSGVTSLSYTPATVGGEVIGPVAGASDRVLPIVKANSSSEVLAAAGTTESGDRFAAFGDSPLTDGNSAAATRLVQWLLTGNGGATVSNSSTIAILNSKASAMKTWLTGHGIGSSSSITTCTAANYATCFTGKSLLIVGTGAVGDAGASAMSTAIAAAISAGTPILWVSDSGYYGDAAQNAALALLGAEYRGFTYFSHAGAVYSTADAVAAMTAGIDQYAPASTLLGHLAAADWNADFTGCATTVCDANPTTKAYLASEFYPGARDFLKAKLNTLDSNAVDLFGSIPATNRLLKLFVLLGDVYRRDITYSATPTVVSNNRFFTTYFADFAVYNTRTKNAAQPDLGTFSAPIPATVTHYNDTLTFDTKTQDYFTAAGVYALPGQTFTITRNDSGTRPVQVAVNDLRSGSTQEMENYSRPKFLTSPWITVTKGATVAITSPYGGPLQIRVSSVGETSTQVSVSISNVGHHPVWNGPATSAAFAAGIAKGDYSWAEILTPGIQIHSTLALMRQTLEDPAWDTPEKLAAAAMKYHFQSEYGVAGFIGTGLTLPTSVQNYCTANSLTCTNQAINAVPAVTHFNADQATCGYGCSGNPYDAWWPYSVIGWGDSHEIGHNIQRFKVYDSMTTEVTNNIYSAHTPYLWNKEVPYFWRGVDGKNFDQDATFAAMVAAQDTADPIATMKSNVWGDDTTMNGTAYPDLNWGLQRLEFYLQLVQQSRENTAVSFGNDGWDFWTAMNVVDREFGYDASDDARWSAHASALGFGGMTRSAASALSGNDRLLVETSKLAHLDQRPYFDMWGVTYTKAASDQVATLGYPKAAKRFWYYPMTADGLPYFFGDAAGSALIDGSVASLPKVPMMFNFTQPDRTSTTYPWPQIRSVAVKKPITLQAAVATASKVAFKADGTTIPGCEAVTTAPYDWTAATSGSAGGQTAGEKVATCVWYPQSSGSRTITTTATADDGSFLAGNGAPITVNVTAATDAPSITSMTRTSGLEGTTVILNGTNLSKASAVTFNGVNATFTKAATKVTVTIPSVTPSQVSGAFVLTTTTGYRTYSPGSFTVVKPVSSVSLSAASLLANPGRVLTLGATVSPSYATNKAITWTTSDATVATVDSTGRVVAVKPGTATITATTVDGAKSATSTVTVTTSPIVDVLAVRAQPVVLDQGASADAAVTVLPANASLPAVVWTSADPTVASVTSAGRVTGVAVGTTTLTATASDGMSSTVAVSVNVPVTGNDTTNTVTGLTTGMQFSTNNGSTWTTSTGSNLPVLTGNIMLKVRKVGTTAPVKSILFTDGTNSVSNPTTSIVAGDVYLSDLAWATQSNGWGRPELDSSNAEYATGDGRNLAIKGVTYARGIGVHASSTITYTLSGNYARFITDVGPDDETSGSVAFQVLGDGTSLYSSGKLVKSGGAKHVDVSVVGVTTLTLIVTDGGDGNGSDHADWAGARLVPAVGSVTLTPAVATVAPGATTTLTGTAVAQVGVTPTLTWTSSNTAVATVNSSGVVTGVAAGIATITATSSNGGASASSIVRVAPAQVTSLVLSSSTMTLSPIGTGTLTPTVTAVAGADTTLTWRSANPAIATVDSSGKVSAVAIGTTTVTVSAAGGAYEATATIIVSPGDGKVTGVTLDQSTASVKVGAQVTLVATVAPFWAFNKAVTWKSSKPTVATVSSTGVVTAVAAGSTVITVKTTDGAFVANATITVTP